MIKTKRASAAVVTGAACDVPQASRLRYLLAESGIELPECYQLEELADSLAAYLKGGAGHAS